VIALQERLPVFGGDGVSSGVHKIQRSFNHRKHQEMDDQQKKIDELEAELAKIAPQAAEDNSNSN